MINGRSTGGSLAFDGNLETAAVTAGTKQPTNDGNPAVFSFKTPVPITTQIFLGDNGNLVENYTVSCGAASKTSTLSPEGYVPELVGLSDLIVRQESDYGNWTHAIEVDGRILIDVPDFDSGFYLPLTQLQVLEWTPAVTAIFTDQNFVLGTRGFFRCSMIAGSFIQEETQKICLEDLNGSHKQCLVLMNPSHLHQLQL